MLKDWRALVLLALCLAASGVAVWLRQREGQTATELPVEKGGVRLTLLQGSASPGTTGVRAGAGDYQLEHGGLRVTVGGRRDSAESRQRWGALLDVLLGNPRAEHLEMLRTVVSVEGELRPLSVSSVLPDISGERPVLVVVQRTGSVQVTTRVEVGPEPALVRLESVLENVGNKSLDRVQLGDAVDWPGTPTYAPRMGFVTEPDYAELQWLAKEGSPLSYALVFDDGPMGVSFLFDHVGALGNVALGESTTLEPGGRLGYRRSLLVTDRGLAAVSAEAFRRLGKTLGRVRGRVEPPPRSGTLEALLPDGRPVTLLELPRSGRFELSLPVGSYSLLLTTPGGVDRADVEVGTGRAEDVRLLAPTPGSLRYQISDLSGRLMPGRLSVRGVPPTKNPDFGGKQRSRGVRNVAYSASGRGTLELPPGRYRVFVTRGFEYSIFDQEIEVDAQSGASVRANLARQLDTQDWVSGDFHVHAAPSFDSSVPLKDRVISLVAEGVGFAVATDHNHVTDYSGAVREADIASVLAVSSGIEVTTKSWGHFIAFPYAPEIEPPPYEGVDPGLIFSAIRQSAPHAVIQVNHPRMSNIAYFAGLHVTPELCSVPPSREATKPPAPVQATDLSVDSGERAGGELLDPPLGFSFDFDTLEVVNGFELGKPDVIWQNVLDWFALLNLGYRYTAVGNSDSHSLVHQWAGYPRTYVKVATRDISKLTPEEVASALLYGRAQISNGIFIEVSADNWAGPGDELSLEASSLPLRVLARAAPWVSLDSAEVWVNGVKRAETRATASATTKNRIQWATEMELSEDSWLVVIARGGVDLGEQLPGARGKPFAMTNPIFIDVDGDGVFRAPLAIRESDQAAGDSGTARDARAPRAAPQLLPALAAAPPSSGALQDHQARAPDSGAASAPHENGGPLSAPSASATPASAPLASVAPPSGAP